MATDEKLAAQGTREAFDELYARYRTPVYQFIVRQVSDVSRADDLFQATFIKVFRNLTTFRGQSSFKTWVFTIAHHCVIDDRRTTARPSAPLDESLDVAAPFAREAVEHAEEVEIAKRALDALPAQHKSLFLLVRFHGLRIAEAGAAVGLTPGSAKVTLLRVQRRLGELLERVRQ